MNKEKIEPWQVIGIAVRTTNMNGQAAHDIPELWGKFLGGNVLERIPNKVDNTIYAIYTDYEGDHTKPYTTILACKVKSLDMVPEGLIGRSFGGGEYVKISAKGDLDQGLVYDEWLKIWSMDLDRRFSVDFEMYGEKAQNPQDAEVDIMIAIK